MRPAAGRIGRFVAAARRLLLLQLCAALLVIGLAVWAVVAVRSLADERDRLQARIIELEQNRPASVPTAQQPTAPEPQELPPPRLPMLIPMPIDIGPGAGTVPPDLSAPSPGEAGQTPPPAQQAPDCSGANANQPGCRRGRWVRPAEPQAPPQAQPGTNQQGSAPPNQA